VRFVTELVTLDDLAGAVDPADRVARHAKYLGCLGGADTFAFRYVHFTPQCLRVVSIIRCAAAVMLGSLKVSKRNCHDSRNG
jgi:hypothetical protein